MAEGLPALVDDPIQAVWPREASELLDYEIGFNKAGIVVRFTYLTPKPFDAPAQEAIRNALRRALNAENLNTAFEWQDPRKVRAALNKASAK